MLLTDGVAIKLSIIETSEGTAVFIVCCLINQDSILWRASHTSWTEFKFNAKQLNSRPIHAEKGGHVSASPFQQATLIEVGKKV